MDNFAIRSALVTQQSSKTQFSNNIDFAQLMSDSGNAVSSWLASISLDKRNVAVAGLNTYWIYELIKGMEPEWAAIIEAEYIAQEQVLMTKKPNSLLFVDAEILLWSMYKAKFPDADLCFVNNHSLFFLEHIAGELELPGPGINELNEYSVVEPSEISENTFDMAICWGWSLVGNDKLVKDLVDSLNPGGVLLIGMSNHNTKLYREDFHIHPYSSMHEILKNSDGNTYHLANGYGQTVFIKN